MLRIVNSSQVYDPARGIDHPVEPEYLAHPARVPTAGP
jgi:hypothetical protein